MDELLGNETASGTISCLTFSISLVGDAPEESCSFHSITNDAKSSAKVIETTNLDFDDPGRLKNQMANAGIDTNEVDLSPIFSGSWPDFKPGSPDQTLRSFSTLR